LGRGLNVELTHSLLPFGLMLYFNKTCTNLVLDIFVIVMRQLHSVFVLHWSTLVTIG